MSTSASAFAFGFFSRTGVEVKKREMSCCWLRFECDVFAFLVGGLLVSFGLLVFSLRFASSGCGSFASRRFTEVIVGQNVQVEREIPKGMVR